MVEITKEKLITTIWRNFRTPVFDNIKKVTLLDGAIVNMKSVTAAFPDELRDSKSSYPVIVIEMPTLNTSQFTFGKKKVRGTIKLSLYTLQSYSADRFLEDTINLFESKIQDLADLQLFSVKVDDTDAQMISREAIKLHKRYVMFSFEYIFRSTGY